MGGGCLYLLKFAYSQLASQTGENIFGTFLPLKYPINFLPQSIENVLKQIVFYLSTINFESVFKFNKNVSVYLL